MTDAQQSKRRIRKNFLISAGASGVMGVVALGQLAVLTKSVTLEDYGLIVIVLSLYTFLVQLLQVRVQDVIYAMQPRYEAAGDRGGVAGLVYVCVGLSLVVGTVIATGTYFSAPLLAEHVYDQPELTPIIRWYTPVALIMPLSAFAVATLRMADRFVQVVLSQLLAQVLVVVGLLAYFLTRPGYDLLTVVLIVGAGEGLKALLPTLLALRQTASALWQSSWSQIRATLGRDRRQLVRMLFHTNLTGYLQLATDPGDLFLLGIFANPQQVAIYGVARRLSQPAIVLLSRNLNAAITPEIVSMVARREWSAVVDFVGGYTRRAAWVGLGLTVLVMAVLVPLVPVLTEPQFTASRPVLALLLVAVYMQVTLICGYPLCMAMDRIGRRNLGLLLGNLPLIVVILTGLTALKMAAVTLAPQVMLLLVVYLPLWRELKRKRAAELAT